MCQLKILEQEALGCHKPAFVTEDRLLEVWTEWLFKQGMQRLVEGHVSVKTEWCTKEVIESGIEAVMWLREKKVVAGSCTRLPQVSTTYPPSCPPPLPAMAAYPSPLA